jgi:tRNA(Ile)-lysidine synthase
VSAASRNHEPITALEAKALLAPLGTFDTLALAVSGGSDSVALMTLVAEWATALATPPRLAVLTVDHGLRAGSADEARRVVGWAEARRLAAHVLTWTGGKPSTGIQAAAREARYRLMRQWCDDHGFGPLVTAHTLEDQAETVLMRLARGSGVEGLAAMPAESLEPWHVLRPLLAVPRARLLATLAQRGQPYIDDPSNRDTAFERVRTRALLAHLAEAGLSGRHIALAAARLRRANVALEGAVHDAERTLLAVAPEGAGTLERAGFAALPEEIRIRLIGRAVARFGGRPAPLRLAAVEALERWVRGGSGVARTLGGCRLVRQKAALLFGREPGRLSPLPIALAPGAMTIWDRRFAIAVATPQAGQSYSVIPVGSLTDRPGRPAGIPDFVWRSSPAILADSRPIWLFGCASGSTGQGVSVEFLAD